MASTLKYNREMGKRLAEEAATDCVIVASFFDDFAQGDGLDEALMCKRHLQEALDLLS